MMFFDTNILVYAQQTGQKARIAQDMIAQGGCISVQVLNELTNVLHKKLRRSWPEIEDVLSDVGDLLKPATPITAKTHAHGLALARDHGLSFFDALIIASALESGCEQLITEDMQHGRRFGPLTLHNPFLD
jgi:predicted nucleic acid-binding protein